MSQVQRTRPELLMHLREQIGFLRTSGDAFDRGNRPEARRLSVALRILLHQTDKSQSLCHQLGFDATWRWLDYSTRPVPGNLLPHTGVLAVAQRTVMGHQRVQYIPAFVADLPLGKGVDLVAASPAVVLGEAAPEEESGGFAKTYRPFEHWWSEQVVLTDVEGTEFTRRDLVIAVANKDGGGHVDPKLPKAYDMLQRGTSTGWQVPSSIRYGATVPLPDNPVLPAIRHIAEEVIRTFDAATIE